MSCDPDRLLDHLDGELDAGSRAEVEAHLETCAVCRAELAELRRVTALAREAVRDDQVAPLTGGELRAMLDALSDDTATPAERHDNVVRLAPRVAAVAAVVAALAAVLVLALRGPLPTLAPLPAEPPAQERMEIRMATGNPSVQVIWVMSRDLEL